MAVSTPILLEYEEVVRRLANEERWQDVARAIELTSSLHGNIRHVSPTFQFRLIATDPDDNAFVDCAIAGDAEYIVTEDRHFDVLIDSGHRPQPIRPQEFIETILAKT